MKSIPVLALLCLALLMVPGCDSDEPAATRPVPLIDIVVPSSDYLNHRFFRLDLPDREPGGRLPGDRILLETLKFFRLMDVGVPQVGDLPNVAAYVDSLGFRNWAAMDFQEPHLSGSWWREVYRWDAMLDAAGELTGVDLRESWSDEDVLAVTYEVRLADGTIARVGDRPGLDVPRQEIGGQEGLYYRMKLLKAPAADKEPVTFRYVLRNIYSLGMVHIDAGHFGLRIERNVEDAARPQQDESGLDYIRIFGLDRDNSAGTGFPDGLVDWWNPAIFDLARGLVKFPLDFPGPFAPGGRIQTDGDRADQAAAAVYAALVDTAAFVWNPSYLRDHQAWQLYDPAVLSTEYPQFGHFRIIATHPDPERYQP